MKYLIMFVLLFSFSCTEQQRAKKYGGSATVELPTGKKLVNATWKMDNLWLLVEDRKEGETPKEYIFRENSSYGMLEGQIVIKEK